MFRTPMGDSFLTPLRRRGIVRCAIRRGIYAVTSCLLRPKPGSIRPSLRGQAGIRANLLDQCALELIR